ncbi:class I adenylate-forming enzyme family protein [Sphingobium estronivorans]|uniref:class I adenylate-forming enzyme family protein n=1 Tax=Sphingobium estronivorans TaxID=1577690 RepID=UPI00123A0D0D|nr:class I adenylate-forming enzyme family protein [Sphingobium estronivorans]
MARGDPVFADVTAPGTPFEIGERGGIRYFRRAPDDLALLIESARRHGDATFLVEQDDAGRERRLSYAQMFDWRDRLASRLGIGRGDRVAICMRNRAEWMVAFMAVIRMGGVAVLLNSRGAPAELAAMIEDADPALVLADAERAALIRQSSCAVPVLDALQPEDLGPAGALPEIGGADADDPCAILFTSGTTGRVKGAVLSHRSLMTGLLGTQLTGMMVLHNMARNYGVSVESIMAQVPPQATLLVYPLFHISGLGSAFLAPLLSGAKVVIMRRWDAAEAVRIIADEKITMLTSVPTMLWDMIRHAKQGEMDLSSLRNIGSGGQALPLNLLDEVRALCPHAMIGVGYGMTETAGAIAQAVGADFLNNPAAAGRVLPLIDLRIAGSDGQAAPVGESGEIQVRGAMVMSQYWNRPEENAKAFTEDGWLRTGDVGRLDEDGYLFIVDRMKDMVISGGENIYCAEVERVIGEMPQVVECATFGIPDERLGEQLVAIVVGRDVDERAVTDWVLERLARYKAPARVVVIPDPLPRTHLDKIDKIALRALWPQLAAS